MYIPKGYVGIELPAAMVDHLRSIGVSDEDLSNWVREYLSAYK